MKETTLKKKRAPQLTEPVGEDESKRHHMSLSLTPKQFAQLKQIAVWALTDPKQADAKPGMQQTVLYAIDHIIANPPAHVRSPG